MRIGLRESIEIKRQDNKSYRRKMLILILVTIAAFLVFMNVFGYASFASPRFTWGNIKLWFEYAWATVTGQPRLEIINARPTGYGMTMGNIKQLVISMSCGALLALSGNIFQNVFRNPMAAPTMLGVNTGVQMALLYMTVTYEGMALSMTLERYKFCYIGAAAMLALIMILGKLASGRGRFAVDDLILVGVATSQILGAIITGYANGMDTGVLAIYQQLTGGGVMDTGRISTLCLVIAFLVSVIPMYLVRFSFNAVSYTPDETRGLGIDSNLFRFLTLILGTFMVTAAMVHCGTIGMLSLAVPHIGRYIFGSEFRKQFWANMLLGALLMLVCRGVVILLPYVGGTPFPVSIVVNVMVPPVFAFFMAKTKRGWE